MITEHSYDARTHTYNRQLSFLSILLCHDADSACVLLIQAHTDGLPPIIIPKMGFRLDLGKPNPLKGVTLNMYDYTDHYRNLFHGKSTFKAFHSFLSPAGSFVCLCTRGLLLTCKPECLFMNALAY